MPTDSSHLKSSSTGLIRQKRLAIKEHSLPWETRAAIIGVRHLFSEIPSILELSTFPKHRFGEK